MSLKQFHVVFIVASAVLSFLLAAWGIGDFSSSHQLPALLIGVVAAAAGVGLSAYLTLFRNKLGKHLS
jgi:hypothetical protein